LSFSKLDPVVDRLISLFIHVNFQEARGTTTLSLIRGLNHLASLIN